MSETNTGHTLVGYRDEVTELMQEGYPFGDVENAIDGASDLTEDAKAALWLLAFSLRAPGDQLLDARAQLTALR